MGRSWSRFTFVVFAALAACGAPHEGGTTDTGVRSDARPTDASPIEVDCEPTLSSGYTAMSQPYSVFVVHLEPGVTVRFPTPDEPSDVFVDGLQPLVARADALRIPLSIFMHQAWVDYIYANGHEALVRSWVDPARGGAVHEIGIHNHGPAHAAAVQSGYSNWSAQAAQDVNDFYTRGRDYDFVSNYRGTITDVASNIAALTGTAVVSGSTMQSWHESPPTLLYEQVGAGTGRNSRFARVRHWSPSGGFRDAHLFNAAPMTFSDIEASGGTWPRFTVPAMVSEQTWGVTVHAHNFREITNRAVVERYLCAIASIDPTNAANKRRTVRDLMENVALPVRHTFMGYCGDGYCDSREAGPDPLVANPFPIPSWGDGTSTSSCLDDCAALGSNGTGNGDLIEAAGRF